MSGLSKTHGFAIPTGLNVNSWGTTVELASVYDLAERIWGSVDVCFGSKADIAVRFCNVRFTPKSGHRLTGRSLLCGAFRWGGKFDR